MATRSRRLVRNRTKPKVAWLTNHDRYFTLTMTGFEEPDLEAVKDSAPMTFDRQAKCWIIHRNDARWVREALDDLDFITIERSADDER